MWAEQDNCDPLELYDAACIESGRKWIARRRVLKLLEGLRGCFHGRRASLLHQPLLPSIEETIAAMSQEEVRLSLEHADMKAVPSSTFAVTERMEWSDPNKCHICGEVGHWKWACPTRGRGREYNGGGTGRGRSARGRGGYSGTSRGQASMGRGGYSGHLWDQRAHMTVAGDTGTSKGKDADDADYGDFALWASTDEGNPEQASLASNGSAPEWVLDSGASKHVASKSCVFESYTKHPPSHTGTMQTADGTNQPVIGVGTVKCTPTISLSSVLHVPAFPVNLVSFSALIDQIDCRVILDKFGCVI